MRVQKGLTGTGLDLARVVWWILLITLALPLVWTYLTGPKSPVPDHLNPQRPFDLSQPQSPWTMYKFRRALADPQKCLDALATGTIAQPLPPIETSDTCTVLNPVSLTQVGQSRLSSGGVDTACATALRIAAWERYGLQPAARTFWEPAWTVWTILAATIVAACAPHRGPPAGAHMPPQTRWILLGLHWPTAAPYACCAIGTERDQMQHSCALRMRHPASGSRPV